MLKLTKKLPDPLGIVTKLVFEDDNGAIAESVVYSYEDRGVVCFSVQSGCPVGCVFCGTGNRFIRNLSMSEILLQLDIGHRMIASKSKQQYMSMSMGEPMLNYSELREAIEESPKVGITSTHFYISTVGIMDPKVLEEIFEQGERLRNFGLQFSLHDTSDYKRWMMLGQFEGLMSLSQIRLAAGLWKERTGKPAYFNYICRRRPSIEEVDNIHFITRGHHVTFSVLYNINKFAKGDPAPAIEYSEIMLERHPDQDVSVFDPAGQDTIGGGCGQLLYVQEKLRRK